jgi:hypothetical protein
MSENAPAAARISRLGFAPAESDTVGPVISFMVAFPEDAAMPGSVEVALKLVTRWRAELSRRWVRDALKYVPRHADLWPGATGFCIQKRRCEIYRLELHDGPRAFWDPKAVFDFTRHEKVELTVQAKTHDKIAAQRTFTFILKRRARNANAPQSASAR